VWNVLVVPGSKQSDFRSRDTRIRFMALNSHNRVVSIMDSELWTSTGRSEL